MLMSSNLWAPKSRSKTRSTYLTISVVDVAQPFAKTSMCELKVRLAPIAVPLMGCLIGCQQFRISGKTRLCETVPAKTAGQARPVTIRARHSSELKRGAGASIGTAKGAALPVQAASKYDRLTKQGKDLSQEFVDDAYLVVEEAAGREPAWTVSSKPLNVPLHQNIDIPVWFRLQDGDPPPHCSLTADDMYLSVVDAASSAAVGLSLKLFILALAKVRGHKQSGAATLFEFTHASV